MYYNWGRGRYVHTAMACGERNTFTKTTAERTWKFKSVLRQFLDQDDEVRERSRQAEREMFIKEV